jgi:hypothetical protein
LACACAQREAVTAEGIYESLVQRRTAVDEDVAAAVALYRTDKPAAQAVLVNTILRLCGGTHDWTLRELGEEEVAELVDRVDTMLRDEAEYPLDSSRKDAKKAYARAMEFWRKLVVAVKEEILYDDVLIPDLIKVT